MIFQAVEVKSYMCINLVLKLNCSLREVIYSGRRFRPAKIGKLIYERRELKEDNNALTSKNLGSMIFILPESLQPSYLVHENSM